ncbi:AAA family ATPase [Stappia sp.]|uniref:AAA family ATPase n=1 Tax=Stappia sp. TaxID=1870903 RepID=UPI003D1352B7
MFMRAVIVGASTYRQKEIFSSLPGAARDAVWFERFILSKGVSDACLTRLVGDAATKDAILTAIRETPIQASAEPHALMIFFSGHGGTLRLPDGRDECVLFCHDTSIRNRLGSSIGMTELLEAVSDVRGVDEVYLFLDACHVTLASLARQLRILAGRANAARVFCGIMANDGGIAVEGFASPMGEFSSILLASLRHTDNMAMPSVGALAMEVARRAARTGVTSPTSVLLGDPTRWPFPSGVHIPPTASSIAEVFRSSLVEKALELLRSRDGVRVCITGASGTGKSVVLKQVARLLGQCPIASFTRGDTNLSPETVCQRAVEAITEVMPESDQELVVAHTLSTAVRAFVARNPHPVIAIDGGENLPNPGWFAILKVLDQYGVDLITTRHDKSVPGITTQNVDIEPMSLNELAEMPEVKERRSSQDSIARACAISGGYPLPFLTALRGNQSNAIPSALQRTEQILRTAGGYCSQSLFCALTGVEETELDRLRGLGLLVQSKDLFRLHDAVRDSVSIDSGDAVANAIVAYWQAEQTGKNALTASLRIIELCLNSDLQFSSGTVATAMRIAEGRVTSRALANAAVAAAKGGGDSALIEAIDILSRRGDSELLATLLAVTDRFEFEGGDRADPRLLLAKARAAWWAGDYSACRLHAKHALRSDQQSQRAALLELAIADFFEGRWSTAQDLLEQLVIPGPGDLRAIGWAQLILGTCLGIRGLSGERGRMLLRSAAELLRATNDLAGVAIAKGNCGEVSWKSADFESSYRELQEGLEIAEMLGMSINAVESRRNLIQLYLRQGGPDDNRIKPLEQQLCKLSIQDIGRMEMMQVANTLATLNLYRGNLSAAETWMELVRPLTANNDEYDIYTRANDGILLAMAGREGSRERIVAAADLCAAGSNRLALIQIRQDVVFCLGRKHTKLVSELLKVIDKRTKGIVL